MQSILRMRVIATALLFGSIVTGCGPSPEEQASARATRTTLAPPETPQSTPKIYTLMANVIPEGGGSVVPQMGQFEQGSEISVSAEAVMGYALDHWSGDHSGRSSRILLVMDSNKEITAHFDRAPTLIVFSSGTRTPDFSHLANALIDFDTDGDLDLITSARYPSIPSLFAFRNDGNGSLINDSGRVFADLNVELINAVQLVVADFNGDDLDDLFIADMGQEYPGNPGGGQSRIFMQNERGQLIDETEARLPQQMAYTRSIATGDVDGDGDVDIYMGNVRLDDSSIGPGFYMNNGTGYFSDASARFPGSIHYFLNQYASCLLVDVDNDNDLDLILGAISGYPLTQYDTILLNDGYGDFREAPQQSLPPRLGGSLAETNYISSADFNQDGWQDLLISTNVERSYRANLQLLMNGGDGTFRDETFRIEQNWVPFDCGEGYANYIVGMYIVDSNNDGWPDILAQGASCMMHLLFESLEGESFSVVDNFRDYRQIGGPGPLIPGDLDGDGIMDVVLFYAGENHQVLLRVLPTDPLADREPVVWE